MIGNGEVKLGRAYGAYSRVIFYGTYLSSVVSPQGWDAWGYTGQECDFFHPLKSSPYIFNNNRLIFFV